MRKHLRPLDEKRRSIFLETLRQTGSIAAAARAATPYGSGRHPGESSFCDLRRSDPVFAVQVKEALEQALGLVEKTISDRAIHGWKRPVFQRGEKVGEEQVYDNNLLLRLAERLSPEWRTKTNMDITQKSMSLFVDMSPEQICGMPPDLQKAAVAMLEWVASQKKENTNP